MTLRRNLPLLLLSVREQVRSHFQPVFREFGITEQQWRILRGLYENPGQSVVELAETCCILKPSVVGILARMVELDLIDREKSKIDKRRSHVYLAPKGRDLVEKIVPILARIYLNIEEAIGKKQLDAIYMALDKFNAAMEAVNLGNESYLSEKHETS